jgi:hypothetical protein
VVIHDLNVKGIAASPNKTQAELIVYPNAVLAFPVSAQSFEPIPSWNRKIIDFR